MPLAVKLLAITESLFKFIVIILDKYLLSELLNVPVDSKSVKLMNK